MLLLIDITTQTAISPCIGLCSGEMLATGTRTRIWSGGVLVSVDPKIRNAPSVSLSLHRPLMYNTWYLVQVCFFIVKNHACMHIYSMHIIGSNILSGTYETFRINTTEIPVYIACGSIRRPYNFFDNRSLCSCSAAPTICVAVLFPRGRCSNYLRFNRSMEYAGIFRSLK